MFINDYSFYLLEPFYQGGWSTNIKGRLSKSLCGIFHTGASNISTNFSNIDPLPTLCGEFHIYFFEAFPEAVLSSAHIHNIQPSRHPT